MRFRLNLGSLWELRRTVELGSVTKAAEELGLSQPALTRRIMRLEHDLRVNVLVRDHDGVKPTDMGAMILERAQALFDQVHALEEEIAAASGELKGEVAVCLPTTMHRVVTLPFLKVAAERMPDVRIRLIDAFDAVLHEQLVNRNADVGIIIHENETSIPGLRLDPLVTDQLCLVGTGTPAGERAAVKIADLADQRLVLPSQNNGLRRKIDAAFRRVRIKPDITEVDSYRAMTDLVRTGQVNTITPSCGLTPGGTSLWWSPITRLSINWTFAVQESRMQSIVVRAVGDLLKQQVACWTRASAWAHSVQAPVLGTA
ncbi:MAG TPA: LysR substrate-binding domain-containing protein [Bradyrhizobium sp.]